MNEKTDTITIRLKESLKNDIEKIRKKNHVTLNTAVNQILIEYFQWTRHERDMGWMCFTRPVFKMLLNYVPKDELTKRPPKLMKEEFVDAINFFSGQFTIDTFLNFLDSWFTFAKMPHKITHQNDAIQLIVHHDVGLKGSLYCITTFSNALQDIDYKLDKVITKSTKFSFEIRKI